MSRSDESEQSVDDLLADVDRLTEGETDGAASAGEATGTERPAASTERSAAPAASTDDGSSVRERLGGLFSVRTFLVALVLSVVAVVAGGAIPLVGFLGRLGGLFVVAFAVGLLGSGRRYAEVGLAAAVASGLGFVAGALSSTFVPFAVELLTQYGVAIAGVGAGVGALAALVGHYLGRDLRAGLTRDL